MFTHKRTLLAGAIFSALTYSSTTYAGDELGNTVNTDFEVIVVSGSKTEKPLKDVSGSISVLTEEDLENQVIMNMNHLFKYDPSIQVTGNTGEAQNFIIRGMGGDRVLMIKDGMRMNEGYGANGLNDVVGRGFIETDILKQVEVAKGAASSLYGSDALGGIVVFTTKTASDFLEKGEKIAGKVKLGYNGESDQNSISGTIAFQTGKLEHLFNASYRDGEEVQNFDETKPELAIESSSFFYSAKYNVNETDYLAFTADVWEKEAKGKIAYGLLEYFRDLNGYTIIEENNNSEKENKSFQLRYHSKQASPFYDQINLSIYQNKTTQEDVEYGQLDINANFGFPIIELRDMWKTSVYDQNTVGFLSNASLSLNNNHTIGYGIDIEKSTSERTEEKLYSVAGTPKNGYPQIIDKFPKTEINRAGLFINDEISLHHGKLIITPGMRFDNYAMEPKNLIKESGEAYKKFDESHVSFNLGGLYKIDDSVSLFAQYGQGFKVPAYDLAYIDHDNSLYGYRIKPSEDLSPEESDSFEVGVRGQVDSVAFNAAVYYTKYDQFLATELVDIETSINRYTGQESQVLVYQYENIDSVTIKGAEIAVQYFADNGLSIFANGSFQDGKDDETGDYIASISPLSGVLGLRYENDNLSTELMLNWAKRMTKVNDDAVEVSGYGSVDWLVKYTFTDELVLNVSVNNLTDKKYVNYVNGAGHAEKSTLNNEAEMGRHVAANIHYRF